MKPPFKVDPAPFELSPTAPEPTLVTVPVNAEKDALGLPPAAGGIQDVCQVRCSCQISKPQLAGHPALCLLARPWQ